MLRDMEVPGLPQGRLCKMEECEQCQQEVRDDYITTLGICLDCQECNAGYDKDVRALKHARVMERQAFELWCDTKKDLDNIINGITGV